MRALLYPEFGCVELADVPVQAPGPDEVLLRVAACGVCGSELETFRRRSERRMPPLVMGHEFCGTIEKTGENVGGFAKGQPVVSNAIVACGQCERCNIGQTNLCPKRQVFGMHRAGAFAEFVAVPARVLLPWPEGLPAAAACLAEPLGNGIHVRRLTRHLKPESILIIGAGPIGLMCLAALRAESMATIIVSDLADNRLDVAASLGASNVIRAGEQDVADAVRQITGSGADLSVDAVGSAATKRLSVDAIRPGGTTVWIGLHDDTVDLQSYSVTLAEKTIAGSYGATEADLRDAIGLLASGRLKAEKWVSPFALSDSPDVFMSLVEGKGGLVKAVFVP